MSLRQRNVAADPVLAAGLEEDRKGQVVLAAQSGTRALLRDSKTCSTARKRSPSHPPGFVSSNLAAGLLPRTREHLERGQQRGAARSRR